MKKKIDGPYSLRHCSLRFARPADAQQTGKIFRIGFLDA